MTRIEWICGFVERRVLGREVCASEMGSLDAAESCLLGSAAGSWSMGAAVYAAPLQMYRSTTRDTPRFSVLIIARFASQRLALDSR